jgi:two-component system LytT family sensor kinase
MGPKYSYSFPGIFKGTFLNTFHLQLITYATILAICHVIDSRRKLRIREMEAAQLSAQLAKAQLDALRHQLEPHFLFNTLNTIAGLIREGRDGAAVTMIAGLSDLLRRVLDDSNRQEISFGEELEFLENYLEIQKMRFADRLQIMMDVPRELYPAQVPSLMLQPIVENAIQHGICKRVNGGAIRIVARNLQGMLTVSVHNDGPGMNGDEANGGIGLSNVRSRLQSLYGSSGLLSIKDHLMGGVEVVLSVPYRQGV